MLKTQINPLPEIMNTKDLKKYTHHCNVITFLPPLKMFRVILSKTKKRFFLYYEFLLFVNLYVFHIIFS